MPRSRKIITVPVTVAAPAPAADLAVLASGCAPCQANQAPLNARRDAALHAVSNLRVPRSQTVTLNTTLAADPPSTAAAATWSGTIGFENQPTGDGRLIESGALRFDHISEDNPAPIRFVSEDVGAHDGAVVVGRMTSVTRSGTKITATGDFDSSTTATEAARQVSEGLCSGVSMDLDDVSFEIRVAADLLDEGMPLLLADDSPERETDADGRITVMEMNADDELMVTTDARIRGVTLVAIPAFADAHIELAANPFPPKDDAKDGGDSGDDGDSGDGEDSSDDSPCSCDEGDDNYDPDCDCSDPANPVIKSDSSDESANAARTLVAAAPIAPPRAWFDDPHLSGPTPLQVRESGRVYGHLATFDTCHIATPQGPNTCTMAPRNTSGYRYFRTGSVRCEDGSEVATGVISLDTPHADRSYGPGASAAHYENTGTAVVDVAAGEDQYGIWVAGALRSTATPEQIRTLRASPLSGDWRRIGTSLELVAALAVNVPGFPVPRPEGLVASASAADLAPKLVTLIAAGMIAPRKVRRHAFDDADIAYLRRLAAKGRAAELRERIAPSIASRAAALAARVHG